MRLRRIGRLLSLVLPLGLGFEPSGVWALDVCPSFSWEGIPTPSSETLRPFHEFWDPPDRMMHSEGTLRGYIKQAAKARSVVSWMRDEFGRPVCISSVKVSFGLTRARVSVHPSVRLQEDRRKILRHERCHQIYYIDAARRLRSELSDAVLDLLRSSAKGGVVPERSGNRVRVRGRRDPFGINDLTLRYLSRLEREIYRDPRHAEIDRTRFSGSDCRGVRPSNLLMRAP